VCDASPDGKMGRWAKRMIEGGAVSGIHDKKREGVSCRDKMLSSFKRLREVGFLFSI
jgi:hypothetical protein